MEYYGYMSVCIYLQYNAVSTCAEFVIRGLEIFSSIWSYRTEKDILEVAEAFNSSFLVRKILALPAKYFMLKWKQNEITWKRFKALFTFFELIERDNRKSQFGGMEIVDDFVRNYSKIQG